MLILTRQRDESILIGDEITLTIVDIRGDKVRVGIEAPRHILVDRAEVRVLRNEQTACVQDTGMNDGG